MVDSGAQQNSHGRINLSRQSVHYFGGASTIFFTVKTDDLFSRRWSLFQYTLATLPQWETLA